LVLAIQGGAKLVTSVCIGVYVFEEPLRLRSTLESLAANTPQPFELVLLPDGPDAATQVELRRLAHLPQSSTTQALGGAACFNRLAASAHADVVILLESGCIVGRQWLESILAALSADSTHGLAGPSTNHCWNEQGLAQHGFVSRVAITPLPEINRIALSVRQRFGSTLHYLEPLHSLSDFCYAVRREVIDVLGAADEAYGLGPCWEMDYNIRAARAGFRGVWACGAYVHRSPFSQRRAANEARLFDASRHRYQDKFCGLRLGRQATAYEEHCKGDACEHFAPNQLIQIRHDGGLAPASIVSVQLPAQTPLVSCIMATSNRPAFVRQSIDYFRRQNYPNRELIILDDTTVEDLSAMIAGDDRIRYIRLHAGLSIGAKRNRGCELARGTFLAQWDDDDYYAPKRLTAQVEPLLSGTAQISALTAGVIFDLPRWQFWRVTPDLHARMFVGDVHGGTLVFHRSLFDRGIRYPDRSIAEDAWFLWHAMQQGAQIRKVRGDDLFIYVRHCKSSWEFRCGVFMDSHGWRSVGEPPALANDRAFYRQYANADAEALQPSGEPLVTCIMPTAGRRHFVPRAIRYFQQQDYANRELLILDSGAELVSDLIPEDPRIRHIRAQDQGSLGGIRNLACRLAAGDYIVHWDDDDWSAPSRISVQMETLRRYPEIDICGLSQVYFYSPETERAWLYTHPPGSRPWLAGNTFCYRKTLWQRRPFSEINEGEDTLFVWALSERQILALPDPTIFLATVHPRNTSPKRTHTPGWNPIAVDEVARIAGADFDSYRGIAPSGPHEDHASAEPQPTTALVENMIGIT
jgi:glycosyltransferase involved in cell wall biosynthesis